MYYKCVCVCSNLEKIHVKTSLGYSVLDVDECMDELELCSPHGECVNTEGSYQCACDSGFVANPDTHFCDGKA